MPNKAGDEMALNDLVSNIRKTISAEPEESRREGMTAQLLVAQNQHVESLPFFTRALNGLRPLSKKKPNLWMDYFTRVLAAQALTLDFLGKIEEAEAAYFELLKVKPAGFFLGEYAVFLHRRKRDFVQAQAYYDRSLQLYPNQSSIHLKYAAFLRHVRRDLPAAEHHYKLSIETNTRNPDAVGSYASFLHGVMGDAPLAETYYRQAVELDRTHANNLCNYGLFLSEEKKKYNLAEQYYQQVLVHTPLHANTLYNYAVMLDSHLDGRKADAETFYRRAIDVEPRHAFALYNLAVLLEDKSLVAEAEDQREEEKLRKLGKEEQARLAALSAAMAAGSATATEGGEGGEVGKEGGEGEGKALASIPRAPIAPGLSLLAKKMKRREEICVLYQRAHEADSSDVTTAADYGRYLLTRMVIANAELSSMKDQSMAANLSLKNEEFVKVAEKALGNALQSDPKNLVALYNLAVLHQKFKANSFVGSAQGEKISTPLENIEKAEFLLKRLLTETKGQHLAAMQQLGRVLVDKFKIQNSSTETALIDTAMDCYENAISMKLDKGITNPTSAASPQTALLEYLKIVNSHATNRQKLRSIAFIEGFMKRCQEKAGNTAAVLTQEVDIRQMLKGMNTVINKGKEMETGKKRH